MKVDALLAFLLLFGLLVAEGKGQNVRTWTSVDGKTLRASLVHADSTSAVFRLSSGREAKVLLERLVEADQALIASRLKTGKAFAVEPMPEATQAPRELDVSGGPRVFQTPHFQFETDQDVLRGFIAEAARVYEGTYHALQGLPLGLDFSPPEGRERFRGRFMNDAAFDQIARSKVPSLPGQRVAGLYLVREKELLVPYSSLGAVRRGSRLSLRKSSDTTTLIHEIVHQVMGEWLPVIPTWFSEGLAEYISAVPYQNGRFDFAKAELGLRKRLEEEYRTTQRIVAVAPPSSYFEKYLSPTRAQGNALDDRSRNVPASSPAVPMRSAGPDGWTGQVREYRDAMLTVYFFMHLFDSKNEGAPVGAYLRMVDSAMADAEEVLVVMQGFEEKVKAYNERIDQYKADLKQYQADVTAYNSRVLRYNEQGEAGVAEQDRIVVGEIPAEPTLPEKLDVPPEIEAAKFGGVVDLVAMVKRASLPGLLQGKELVELDHAMKAAYANIGWEIEYLDYP